MRSIHLKIVCFFSSQGVLSVVIKNWLLLMFGLAVNVNSQALLTDEAINPPGSEFVFYKVTRPKSCNPRSHFLEMQS